MLQKFNKWCDSKQEACQEILCEQEVNEIMPGCHPSYLKTVSLQVFSRIRTHSLRFLTPNTAFLVRVIQIHTNFGWLKWLVKGGYTPKNFLGRAYVNWTRPFEKLKFSQNKIMRTKVEDNRMI
jgi:hypothetical protein